MAQYRQPDFTRGDPNTLGGYTAVHDRPAAFEGSDGYSYSVEILAHEEPASIPRWEAWLFFVKWARMGASSPEGHLETEVLARGHSEAEARAAVGALSLNEVKRLLDALIAAQAGSTPKRKWWDAMNADEGEGHHG